MAVSLRVRFAYQVTDTDPVSGSKRSHTFQEQGERQINVSAASATESAVRTAITNNFTTPPGCTLLLYGISNLDLQAGSSTPQHGGQLYS